MAAPWDAEIQAWFFRFCSLCVLEYSFILFFFPLPPSLTFTRLRPEKLDLGTFGPVAAAVAARARCSPRERLSVLLC